tara:strand:+ start:172 stop:756 length:585 start_codon:yes stop_codon:yes gene_type:complete
LNSKINKYLDLNFLGSFTNIEGLKKHDCVEIAFVGASNVGKSSAINMLSNNKKMSKVSKKPGKTKYLNIFELKEGYIVDLPGYGYSSASGDYKRSWAIELPRYLENRNELHYVYLFTDIRNPLNKNDIAMMQKLEHLRINYQIVLTKSDKLRDNDVKRVLKKTSAKFGECISLSTKKNNEISSFLSSVNALLSN